MSIEYKKINIRKAFHGKFSELCSNQGISLKAATENLILYALKHQIDLNTINENSTSSAKDLINTVGNKVQNLQNTYVSFQKTFEGTNNYLLMLGIIMTYQNKEFASSEEQTLFKKAFFEQAALIRITTHPQQKAINSIGGSKAFYNLYVQSDINNVLDNVGKLAIFEIIELTNDIVNQAISNMKIKQKSK